MDSSESAIKIENVWKVFGNTSTEALDAIQNQRISKNEALEKYNSVIGVSDVSLMAYQISVEKKQPADVARTWMKNNKSKVDGWLGL